MRDSRASLERESGEKIVKKKQAREVEVSLGTQASKGSGDLPQ